MKTYSDLEVSKHLEELLHTIEKGITTANEAVIKANNIRLLISEDGQKYQQIQTDFLEDSRVIEQQQLQLVENIRVATQIRDELNLQLIKIGYYQCTFEQLKEEIEIINGSINTAKNQAIQLEAILPESTKELPQQLEEFKQLASQVAIYKQEAANFLEQIEDKAKLAVESHSQNQQIKSEIELIIKNFGGKEQLDNLQLDYNRIYHNFQEAQTEIQYLNKKLETQTKQQSFFRNWLIAVSIGVAIAFILAIVR
jgi:chromosome segregation ATPase